MGGKDTAPQRLDQFLMANQVIGELVAPIAQLVHGSDKLYDN